MFTVYHLQKSQSERVVWLCEELGLEYDLKIFPRDPQTGMAPPFIKSLTPAGSAPVLIDRPAGSDKEIVIAESSAIVDYIIHVHGGGKLAFKPGEDEYADYLTWFHFSNATLQASLGRAMMFSFIGDAVADSPMGPVLNARLAKHLKMVDDRLGVATYLAGDQLTAADIMTMCTLTTMRGFNPVDLTPYSNILRYLEHISTRPAYRRAMEKGDPGLPYLTGAIVERFDFPGLTAKK